VIRRLGSVGGDKGQRASERYVAALNGAPVIAPGPLRLAVETLVTRIWSSGWAGIMDQDRRFGGRTARALLERGLFDSQRPPATFAYSYGALEILEAARSKGSLTLLGQIDPGPLEHELVAKVAARYGLPSASSPPEEYWRRWREECRIADVIVVNSDWSRSLLVSAGVGPEKIIVAPLALSSTTAASPSVRPPLPAAFTPDRPMRVLFLGRVGVRKGAVELIAAMERLHSDPVHLTFVGPVDPSLRALIHGRQSITVVGAVPRSVAASHYRAADVMILPTHSDGFAITQLEAQAAGVPVVVSSSCGRVINDGKSGVILPEVSAEAIAEALLALVARPERLRAMAERAPAVAAAFTPMRAAAALLERIDREG
jgi:glycosyltransferase involved in cell wall biosynthesis